MASEQDLSRLCVSTGSRTIHARRNESHADTRHILPATREQGWDVLVEMNIQSARQPRANPGIVKDLVAVSLIANRPGRAGQVIPPERICDVATSVCPAEAIPLLDHITKGTASVYTIRRMYMWVEHEGEGEAGERGATRSQIAKTS